MKHFTSGEWVDFVNELVTGSKRQEMDRHLEEGCQSCEKTAKLWQKVRQTAAAAAESQPPEHAVRIAKARFCAERGRKPIAVPGLVQVLFDSFLQPLVAGARSSGSEMRQMLYRADPYQIDLQIEAKPGTNKLVVTGQLLDTRDPDKPGRDIPVVLSNLRGQVVSTMTNEFGEFREEIQASSDLELKLPGENEQAVILSLRDALGRVPERPN
jgi:hypothetical protein